MSRRLSELRSKAEDYEQRGKFGRATAALLQLEALEPSNPRWPQKRGLLHEKLGEVDDAVTAYSVAARRLAAEGRLVKAIGLCKVILRLAPDHQSTQQQLAEFHAQRGTSDHAVAAALTPPGKAAASDPGASSPSVPLARVNLRAAYPETESKSNTTSEIAEIPIELAPARLSVPDTTETTGEILRFLPPTPLFSSLNRHALQLLIAGVELCEYEEGDTVIEEGSVSAHLHVIVDGEAVVLRGDVAITEIERLGDAEFFGEMGLLTELPAPATVRAVTALSTLRVSRELMHQLIGAERRVLGVLLGFFRDRLVTTWLKTAPLLAPFDYQERLELASIFSFVQVERGYVVVEQGEPADAIFAVLSRPRCPTDWPM